MKKIAITLALAFGLNIGSSAYAATVGSPRCEYRVNPLGIDVNKPRLSWVVNSSQRGIKQAAYQVLVSSTSEKLNAGQADRWDSGKIESDQSVGVEYGGPPLASGSVCYWKVRVWTTESTEPATATDPALWTVGLLEKADWQATWIGYDAAMPASPEAIAERSLLGTSGLKWVHLPEKNKAADLTRFGLRKQITIADNRKVRRALLVLYADNQCTAYVNGTACGGAVRWDKTSVRDVTTLVHPGKNVVALSVTNSDVLPAAVIGKILVQFESGDDQSESLDVTAKISPQSPADFEKSDFDDSAWAKPAVLNGSPWGTPSLNDAPRLPAAYLRKVFVVEKPIRRATIYATALGLYEMHLNGKQVGADAFTPGWTEYRKRVNYQTYDVTEQLKQGPNAIGAILGQGWYSGSVAFTGRHNFYGGEPRLLAQLVIESSDGTTQTIGTDQSWAASFGPILSNDLLLGCDMDMRRQLTGWDTAGYEAGEWKPAAGDLGKTRKVKDVTKIVSTAVLNNSLSIKAENPQLGGDPAKDEHKSLRVDYRSGDQNLSRTVAEHETLDIAVDAGKPLTIVRAEYGNLQKTYSENEPLVQAAVTEPSREFEQLPAVKVSEPGRGLYTFDLGQNMVGWARLRISGKAGQKVTVRHGEMLNPDGTLYAANLRGANATDTYVLAGGDEVLEPKFTFHGFRYVEIRGLSEKPELSAVTGIVVHSDLARTGQFECSNPLINQLYHNIIWGQKGNYVEVPTDCPQRDERAGWTGDTQFFVKTAAYNFNVDPFFTRWLTTICEDSQHADGSFAHVSPDLEFGGGATAWGDSALLCTYQMYHLYGDTQVVAAHYPAMNHYMEFVAGKSKNFVPNIGGFGDWLNLGGGASREVIDTAYYAHLADLMSQMAAAVGKTEDAARYAKLFGDVKATFAKFFQPDGSLAKSSQTGYALAFTMNLVPDDLREKATEKYVEEVKRFDWHLATGFIGTPRLLPGLHEAGRDDVAYKILLQETYPSWLFQVKLGATTMWERWDGWTPDRGFQTIGMNSFNHYAFGAVGEYLYGVTGGISTDGPAYKAIRIAPLPGNGVTWAKTSFESVRGPIGCDWKLDGGKLSIDVTVPVNATATICVPTDDSKSVTESGKPAVEAPGLKALPTSTKSADFAVGSGTYHFTSRFKL